MTTTITYPFTTDTNYTYDSDLIEVTGGVAKLKSRRAANSTFAASFSEDANGSWAGGSLTGALKGAAAISDGWLVMTGSTSAYVDFDANLNADSQQVITLKLKYKPNYSGGAVPEQDIVLVGKSGALNNLIRLRHRGTGMWLYAYDHTGTVAINSTFGAWSPTAGVTYEIELNVDITNGATRLFIDGIQFGATKTETYTRDSDINLLRLGASYTGGEVSDSSIKDVIVFDNIQHTENYTPGYTVAISNYSKDNPTIVTNSSFRSTKLVDFLATENVTGSDAVQYTIVTGSQDRYVTGGSAADSNGTYEESSTKEELNEDLDSLVTTRKTVTIKTFLHSEDGNSTPEINLISVEHNSTINGPEPTTLCELEGYIYGAEGPVVNKRILIRPYAHGFLNSTVLHKYEWQTLATTDEEGHFVGDIYVQPTSQDYWELKVGRQRYKIQLPDAAEADLSQLPFFEVLENGQ